MEKKKFGLSSFWLKLIGYLLRTLDHVGRLFIEKGSGVTIPTAYYVLRAIGKCAFPIFVFFAVEGLYHTKSVKNYLLRLGILALARDCFGFAFGAIVKLPVINNPLIGNVFTDLFRGVLALYLIKRKDWFSLLAALPIAYEFLAGYVVDGTYGTLFKADWGAFSIVLFLFIYLFREIYSLNLSKKANRANVDTSVLEQAAGALPRNAFECVGILSAYLLFYLFYRLGFVWNGYYLLPNEFIPIGTYSVLSCLLLLFYNGKRGPDNKVIRSCFYLYYPIHLLILGILSAFFGVLASVI